MNKSHLIILFLLFKVCGFNTYLFIDLAAQNQEDVLKEKGYLALYQAITDLKTDFTLMSIAAHPDDEDIETLTYYRRKRGVKTVVVAATRGEGGQNEIGPELYRELGVIRTYEMWRAGAISGAKYYSLNLDEFGYSKTSEETFEKWGREEPLRRLVFLIRKLQPEVIITNHDSHSGHGHHQAIGILIREAFDMAGDPTKFPEQLENGFGIWQPKRLFQRLMETKGTEVSVPVGEFDPIRGESYAQIAARALSEHRSQGMEFFAKRTQRGPRYTYYKLVKSSEGSAPKVNDLFSGIPDIFEKIKVSLAKFETDTINQFKNARLKTISTFYESPSELKTALLSELTLWQKYKADFSQNSRMNSLWSEQKKELEFGLYHALNLDFELNLSDEKVIRNQNLQIQALLFNGSREVVVLKSVKLFFRDDWFGKSYEIVAKGLANKLHYNQSDTSSFVFVIPEMTKFTVPKTKVFYRTEHWEPPLKAVAKYEFHGVTLDAWAEIDFEIVPELGLQLETPATIIPLRLRGKSKNFVVQIRNNTPDSVSGDIRMEWVGLSQLNNDTEVTKSFVLKREDEATSIKFELKIPVNLSPDDYSIQVTAHLSNKDRNQSYFHTKGLLRGVEVSTVSGIKVGIVKSYDNTLQNALDQLEIHNQLLTSEELRWADLTQFDSIILDIRAYLVREDLRKNNSRILEYVKEGGNLIVMYHKVIEWNPEYGNPQWAPYLLLLSHERVTYENAPIQILDLQHPQFNFPNKITSVDWRGWVQERGLYFPKKWDSKFKPLLVMSDPQAAPLLGGYLVAKYGKGNYIYTSLVWYRQLRALVPGSFRNLANMVGLANADTESY